METSRTFRIFVSSTFSDLKAERNALQEKVFPRLRELAAAHGCRFQAIDLRWGVSEEAALDQQTMKICLGEIERCQNTNLKPNFIILLGDRYGWRPLPYEIPANEFVRILALVSKEEKDLLERWYRRDDNVDPAVYVLQAREFELGSVPSTEFSQLIACLDSTSKETVEEWYRAGEAAGIDLAQYFGILPSEKVHYILQPIHEQDSKENTEAYTKAVRIVENYFWQGAETRTGIEARLHDILENATRDFPNDARLKYTASATEQEIIQGALQVEDANKHVFGFFRSINNLDSLKADLPKDKYKSRTDPRAHDFIDTLDDKITYDGKNHKCQDALKESLKQKLKLGEDNIHSYPAQWSGSGVSEDHIGKELMPDNLTDCQKLNEDSQTPSRLCIDVWRKLSAVILSEAQKLEAKKDDPLQNESKAHEEFCIERVNDFEGRTDLLAAIHSYIKRTDPHPLVVHGVSGIGKSALMAKAIQESGQDVIYRFIGGATPESSNGRALLESLCKQISRRYGSDEATIPSEYKDLVQEFPKHLALAKPDKPLILFLDALDQLSDTDNARSLRWLPTELPLNVHLIVSTLPGECLQVLENRLPPQNRLELKGMSEEEGRIVLKRWFSHTNRYLQDEQTDYVISKFIKTGAPLYLKLAFEEAKLWKSYDPPPELSEDTLGILQDLFMRLSHKSNHGALLVSHSLGYLASAKKGLAEDELLDVLSRDQELYRWFLDTVHHIPDDLVKAVINLLGPDRCEQYQITGSDSDKQRKAEAWFIGNIRSDEEELNKFLASVLGIDGGPRLPVVLWSRLYFDLEPYLTERRADETSLLAFYHTTSFKTVITERYLPEKEKSKRHLNLANYFENQPLYRISAEMEKPSLRKLSEMVFQQTWAGLGTQVEKTLLDFTYLEAKLAGQGVQELIDDYTLVSKAGVGKENEKSLYLLQGALRLSAHVLGKDPLQLPGQLTGRLLGIEDSSLKGLLEQMRKDVKYSWLRPLQPCLDAPGGALIRTLPTSESSELDGLMPDGRQIVSRSGPRLGVIQNELKIWDLETGECVRTLTMVGNHGGHTQTVRTIAVTPDRRRIISGSNDNTLKVWDLESGKCIRTLGHTGSVYAVAVTPNGKQAISESGDDDISRVGDNHIKVWDLESGDCLQTLGGHAGGGGQVALTPDGHCAVSASRDKTLKVWNLQNGHLLRTLKGHTNIVNSIAVTPDGKQIVSSSDKTIKVWELKSGKCLHTLEEHTEAVVVVALTPEVHCAVSASFDKTIKVWNLDSGKCIRTLEGHTGVVEKVLITPDGRKAISGSTDQTIKIWDLDSGKCIRTLEGHTGSVSKVLITPDGRKVISGSTDQTIKIWDLEADEYSDFKRISDGHTDVVTTLRATPDGKWAVSASEDKTLKVWDLESGECKRTLEGHESTVLSVAVTPNGNRAVSGSEWPDKTIKVWDLETGECLLTLTGHMIGVPFVAVTPNGQRVVSVDRVGIIKVWDLESGECIRTLNSLNAGGRSPASPCAIISLDGNRVISGLGGEKNTLEVWDLESDIRIHTLEGHGSSHVTALALTPDGRRAISGTYGDYNLKVWNLESGACLQTLQRTGFNCRTIAVTPEGRQVITIGDSTLNMWDLENGACIRTLEGDSGYIIALTPDGERVVSSSGSRILRIQDLRNDRNLASFEVNGALSCVPVSHDGLTYLAGDRGGRVYFLRLENVSPSNASVITAWSSGKTLAFSCQHCYSWSEIPETALGKEMSCPNCGKPVRLNPFTVQGDWKPIAEAWQKKGNENGSIALHKEEERISRELGDKEKQQEALGQQAAMLCGRKDYDSALALRKEQAQICRELGNKNSLQYALGFQADVLNAIGKKDEALALYQEREQICRDLNNKASLQNSLGQQADILYAKEKFDGAMALYKEQEHICRELGNKDGLQASLGNQGVIHHLKGELEIAMSFYKEQEMICREIGNESGLRNSLGNQAIILEKTRRY